MNNQLTINSLDEKRRRATSSLFRYIESLQGDQPWGDFLDAGTGVNSALWSNGLATTKWVGVSGSPSHAEQVCQTLGEALRVQDEVLVGNWCEPDFLQGRVFDTVLADYLLGAIEGFAPYFQGQLFARLRRHVGKRLYVIGLDPYILGPAASDEAKMVKAIGRLRDCCLMLAGETPYREYPLEWTVDALLGAGFEIKQARRFGNRYGAKWVHGQLDMAQRRLPKLTNQALAHVLGKEIENLRARALILNEQKGGLRHGADYVIACVV